MYCRLVGDKPLFKPMLEYCLGKKFQWNRNPNLYIFIQENAFENVVWKMAAILSRPHCVNWYLIKFKQLNHHKILRARMAVVSWHVENFIVTESTESQIWQTES